MNTSLFPQGKKEEKYFIFNHLSFTILYHKDPETLASRIVGFEVTPLRLVNLIILVSPGAQCILLDLEELVILYRVDKAY